MSAPVQLYVVRGIGKFSGNFIWLSSSYSITMLQAEYCGCCWRPAGSTMPQWSADRFTDMTGIELQPGEYTVVTLQEVAK